MLDGLAVYLALTGARDGITVTPDGSPFTPLTGYMVGNGPLGFVIDETDVTGEEVIERFNEWFDNGDVYIASLFGAWVDGNSRYLDVVEWIPSFSDAVKLAKDRGELAIWDNANQREIATI